MELRDFLANEELGDFELRFSGFHWYIYIYIYIWLVVSTPLKNMKVSWDYYFQSMEK